MTYKAIKLGQTDAVLAVIRVHHKVGACMITVQVSAFSGCDLCHHG